MHMPSHKYKQSSQCTLVIIGVGQPKKVLLLVPLHHCALDGTFNVVIVVGEHRRPLALLAEEVVKRARDEGVGGRVVEPRKKCAARS